MADKIVYDTKHIAELLGIAPTTVRKYCEYLEKSGYSFHKNEYGHRGFFDVDVIAFQKLIKYKSNMSLTQASESVTAWKNNVRVDSDNTPISQHGTQHNIEKFIQEQMEFNKRQMEINEQLLEHNKMMKILAEKRDQNLLLSVNQLLESRKELASSSSQKKWWQFWK